MTGLIAEHVLFSARSARVRFFRFLPKTRQSALPRHSGHRTGFAIPREMNRADGIGFVGGNQLAIYRCDPAFGRRHRL